LGERTLLDVLNVENEVFGARSNLVNGQFAVLTGYYRILASTGGLLRTLDVAVGLPTGDDDEDAMSSSFALRQARKAGGPGYFGQP